MGGVSVLHRIKGSKYPSSDMEGISELGGEVALLNAWLGRRNCEFYA